MSGTVSIPHGSPSAACWPVLSWAHGTTGVADECAPSRDGPGHPSHIYNRLVDAMLDQWVKRGYVVAKTDYEGLGTPGLHPYLVGASEARSIIDIVVAARHLRPGVGTRWAVMGHSQGGHAALFTSALAQTRAPDLDLFGAVAIAPASGAAALISQLCERVTPVPSLANLPLVLLGAVAANPGIQRRPPGGAGSPARQRPWPTPTAHPGTDRPGQRRPDRGPVPHRPSREQHPRQGRGRLPHL